MTGPAPAGAGKPVRMDLNVPAALRRPLYERSGQLLEVPMR
jgi:hypothetical protein